MAVELTEAGREARRKYMREWQRKNRARLRDQENRYWNKLGAQMEAEEKGKNSNESDC